ncbi:alpha-galactosidase [Paenibacillus xerothermodurans]|uniref:Alpha-galactosidase n=1 Tax=Paenibacillus xerothermodurans TaxID=1977292 RepID=A0A2W1N928_PAEXE|nr:alpha-galactosidase [Paenibacillus xerothermodurans]PZE21139.1 alpha-galactosidase [Paenibacillus xerothermodurans]
MPSTEFINHARAQVRLVQNDSMRDDVQVTTSWDGSTCSCSVVNNGTAPAAIKEIVLFQGEWPFARDSKFYGEGYNMLSQYRGTFAGPELIGAYDDRKHYKLPATAGFFTVYNYALLSPAPHEHYLLGFTSCKRFSGELRLAEGRFEIVVDGENLTLAAGQKWELEEFVAFAGANREELLAQYAARIELHHPRLRVEEIPTGWCSWYCFGPGVTEQNIFDNLDAIAEQAPDLRYIQIDDGYQACMGDWLIPGSSFSDMEKLCRAIKDKGFEPAIWVAPFIAERESALFREHPDWFIHDETGEPLPSSRFSFGGWRRGPWYMLDGTHPDARAYLVDVFRTMREKWGCKYFKLDANMWGALPGGVRYLKHATKVDAYRMGMKAVLEGAGADSFLLGCNAPMWPSLGTVHGMRVTGDISRKWAKFKELAREGFSRNWQHNRLWVNDPDCIVLENRNIKLIDPDGTVRRGLSSITQDEFMFHAAYIYASGGMILSGDDVSTMSEHNIHIIKRVLETANAAAQFDDDSFRIGRIRAHGKQIVCVFNWDDDAATIEVPLAAGGRCTDFWSGEDLGTHAQSITLSAMPPHSARMICCE